MRFLLAVLIVLLAAAPAAAADDTAAFLPDRDAVPSRHHPEVAFRFRVDSAGDIGSADVKEFARIAEATLNDPRGWGVGGRVAFVEGGKNPEFTLWLASPERVDAAAPLCDADFSCRVGDDVYINATRWQQATTTYRHRPLREYRQYVVNHEVGHWLGLDHPFCEGRGEPAPVMLQQSKDLAGCEAHVWPLPAERREALANMARR